MYIELAHQRSSDLTLELRSPQDTWVRLFWHATGGEPTVDPVGWYPAEFTPADDLIPLIGESMQGTWWMRCQDHVEGHEGVLYEWRLRFVYDDDVVPIEPASWGRIKAFYR